VEVAAGETDAPADPVQEAFSTHFAGFEPALTSDSREPRPTDSRRWDLATLVTRSQNPMRRKPGTLKALMLVVALLVAVVAIVSLIRLAES